jgi:hypothetical protein
MAIVKRVTTKPCRVSTYVLNSRINNDAGARG